METPVSGSGSGVPNQRLRVFVLFQLSTTWLNSTVMGSVQGYEQDNCTVQCLNQHLQGYIVEHHDLLHGSCLFFKDKKLFTCNETNSV